MDNRVRQLKELNRKYTEITQERIARELNISLSTVNRWFKDRFNPDPLLHDKIDLFINKFR